METLTVGFRQQRLRSVYPIPCQQRPHMLADRRRSSPPHPPAERLKMLMQRHRDLARLCRRQEAVVGSSTCPSRMSGWFERLIKVAIDCCCIPGRGQKQPDCPTAGGQCWSRQYGRIKVHVPGWANSRAEDDQSHAFFGIPHS